MTPPTPDAGRSVYVCRWRCGWAGSTPIMNPWGPMCPRCGYTVGPVDPSALTFGEACARLGNELEAGLGPVRSAWARRLGRVAWWLRWPR